MRILIVIMGNGEIHPGVHAAASLDAGLLNTGVTMNRGQQNLNLTKTS